MIEDLVVSAPATMIARLGRLLPWRWNRHAGEGVTPSSPPVHDVDALSSAQKHTDATEDRPNVERLAIAGTLNASQVSAVFARLQSGSAAKVLDLTAADSVDADLFTNLAHSWQAARGTVHRLAIVLGFGSWVALHQVIPRRLRRLADGGVELGTFYEQQGDGVERWLAGGPIVHDQFPALLAWLRDQSRPSRTWPTMLDTVAMLVRGFAARDEVPDLLIELAAIARTLGGELGANEAAKYAEAALGWIGETPCRARCIALRALASSRLRLGEVGAGVTLLEAAITTAAVIGDRFEEAGAQIDIGLHVLAAGHPERAESRLRRALNLLDAADPQRATLHHHIARALFELSERDDEAEQHATTALCLRWDPRGKLARDDRALLVRIRARRRSSGETGRHGAAVDTLSAANQVRDDHTP